MSAQVGTSQFGQIFVLTQLEQVLRDTLRAWFPVYLAELQRQLPLEDAVTLANPQSIETHRVDARWPEENLPSIVVQVHGTISVERRGQGENDAWWAITILCVVSAPTHDSTLRLSAYYAAAARAILLQKVRLQPNVQAVEWLDERHDRIVDSITGTERTLQVASLTGQVLVNGVANSRAGIGGDLPDPVLIPSEPYPGQPYVDPLKTDVEVDSIPVSP